MKVASNHTPGEQRLRQIVASVPLPKFWTTSGKSASEIRTGTAARSAPVGRETRGTAGRWGRETRPPHRWVTNRYPVHSMLPNSSATGNAILFLAADLFAVDFNSAQCAELKNLDSLPSTYLRGGLWWVCGGFAYKPTTQTVSFARCFLYTFLFLWWVWWVLHKKST